MAENGATEHDFRDHETVLADQGGSGVPALLTDKRLYRVMAHEIERPGTQLLVKTQEVSRLIYEYVNRPKRVLKYFQQRCNDYVSELFI